MRVNVNWDVAIIGGGFYGCLLALELKKYFPELLIIEKEKTLLTRASYNNQARIHNGYHYTRSYLTALRSRINFPRFIRDFRPAIVKDFQNIYAIATHGSKINANQFTKFCNTIEAPVKPASEQIKKLFNQNLIEEVFLVKEYVFDAFQLKQILAGRLLNAKIPVLFNSCVEKIRQEKGMLSVYLTNGKKLNANMVFNCTYSQVNTILKNSGLPLIPLKHELTELALVKVPKILQNKAVTVIDGPFFSIMPFPPRNLYTLSHVQYTPHYFWLDEKKYKDPHTYLSGKKLTSKYSFMIRDARRFIPSLFNAEYVDSIYETKTLLSQNEVDDGRPILFKKDYGFQNFYIILGGKIDNIYDVLQALRKSKLMG